MNGQGERWLVASAVIYSVLHHQGTALSGLGEAVHGTRWADWLDLATPYLVLLPVAAALAAFGADRGAWLCYLLGAITYVEGHGLHLAANSIGNLDAPARGWPPLVHLWDETVGHHLWITGTTLVVVALARAMHARAFTTRWAHVLAVPVGITFFTNAVEGGAPWLGLIAAAFLAAVGLVHRAGLARVLVTAYGLALLLLVGYGVWQGGFPQFTELGWA